MMKQDIHPLIDKLSISENAKTYFNAQKFHEVIQAPVSISTPNNPINEATENWWVFSMQDEDYAPSESDLIQLYGAIMDTRAKFLKENYPDQQMKFYIWYDPQAGNFNFSLINVKEEKLPFGCNIRMASSLGEIWQEFTDDPYKGTIPREELTISEPPEDPKDQISDENIDNYTLSVWAVTLP